MTLRIITIIGLIQRFERNAEVAGKSGKPQLPLFLLRQAARDDAVGLAQIVLQVVVRQARLRVMLDPFHAARRKVRRRAQTRLVLQDFIGEVTRLEGKRGLPIRPAADGEQLAADLPDMRAAPLDHIAGRGERAAKRVEVVIGHNGAALQFRRNGI